MTKRRFWDRARIFSPLACRLLARTMGYKPRVLTDTEISCNSRTALLPDGLTSEAVQQIGWLTSWDGVSLPMAEAFMKGCHMDMANGKHMLRAMQYVGKHGFGKLNYLVKDNLWSTRWKPATDLLYKSIREQASKGLR